MIHQIKGLNYTPNVLQYTCDISDKKTVNAVLTAAMLKHNKQLDILVNNAAKFIFKSIEEASEGDWDTTAAVNIKGHALVTKACLPYLKKDKNSLQSSSIIFLSSLAGFKGQPGNITYAATKAAIAMMSRSCAMDLAQYNIRSNSICPGILETPICAEERRVKKQTFPEFVAAKTGDVMLRRMGDARELANAALFLASAESSYITGIDLFVDGGANACTMMPMLQ
jgi:cyclopentanol dehydrogenase